MTLVVDASLVVSALVPYLALSSAMTPLQPVLSKSLGLSPQALVIGRALQHYGIYLGDSSGTTALKLEGTVAEGRGQLWRLPADALCRLPFTPRYWQVVAPGYSPAG